MAAKCLRRSTPLLPLSLILYIDSVLGQDFKTLHTGRDEKDDYWFHFMTRPDIQAPKFNVRIYDEHAISPGYWFIEPYEDVDRLERGKPWIGPYIYDGTGDLIWAGSPLFDRFKVWDFRVAQYDGQDMLTGISHRDNAGIILNNNYEWVKSVPWAETWDGSNMHEFNVVQNGTRALVFTKETHQKVSAEKSKVVGFNGQCDVMGQGIKELDITVDPPKSVFEWTGTDHIGLDEVTYTPGSFSNMCTRNWDVHHFNSLDKFPDGDFLLSSRHTDTIFKISHTDGSIIWRFGGKKSDFDIPANMKFSHQHHAQFVEQNSTHTIISLFDNAKGWDGDDQNTNDHSRAMVVALHEQEKTAELLLEIPHPKNEFSKERGSHQILPDGNHFVCWSAHTRLSEHGPDGKLLMHTNTKPDIGTYRGYKFPWVGHPRTPPNVYSAAFLSGEDRQTTMAYVSWNGATEVKKWRLYEADAEGGILERLNETARRGFETDITYAGFAKYVIAEAVDGNGQTLGQSEVVQTLTPVENSVVNLNRIPPSSDWKNKAMTYASDPISTFVVGFVACAVIWAVFRFVRRPKGRSRWRSKAADYELAPHKEQEGLLGEGDGLENMSDEGADTREKIT